MDSRTQPHSALDDGNKQERPAQTPGTASEAEDQGASMTPPSAEGASAPQEASPKSSDGAAGVEPPTYRRWNRTLRPLRTYKDDVAEALGKKGGSSVRIVAAEEERRSKERELAARAQKLQEEIEREGSKIRASKTRLEQEAANWEPPQESAKPKKKGFFSFSLSETDGADAVSESESADAATETGAQNVAAETGQEDQAETRQEAREERELQERKLRKAAEQAAHEQERLARREQDMQRAQEELARVQREREVHRPVQLEPKQKETAGVSRQSIVTVAVSVALLSAAASIGYLAYLGYQRFGTVPLVEGIPTFLSANEEVELPVTNLSRENVVAQLADAQQNVTLPSGSVQQVHVVEIVEGERVPISAERFLATFAARAPARLGRSLNDTFVLGFHVREIPTPFLIFKTDFFENTFASMLEWEPLMSSDLAPLFGPPVVDVGISRGSGFGLFTDRVVQNKDTRILFDEQGSAALVYSFVDSETLIIAPNIETFLEVFGRLTSQRVVR